MVQLTGSIRGSIVELGGVSVTARLADAFGAKAHYLHAPMLVADAVVREGLMPDPHIRKTLEVARTGKHPQQDRRQRRDAQGTTEHRRGALGVDKRPDRTTTRPRRCWTY